MLNRAKTRLANLILGWLFLPAPEMALTPEKKAFFDQQFIEMQAQADEAARLPDPYLAHEFLRYLVREKGVLLHGSNHTTIDTLLPKKQTDWNGRPTEAVFASGDGIWPLFFAVVKHAGYRGSLRNGCFVVGDRPGERRYYFFSLNASYQTQQPWQDGVIYILPGATFQKTGSGLVRFDEWVSPQPVRPLARLRVTPQDFPFLHQVAWHEETEKMTTSWLHYKKRLGGPQ